MGLTYLKGVVTLTLVEENCVGCGVCLDVCPHSVFRLKDRKVQIVDKDSCMECGACARNCAFEALQVRAGVGCAYAIILGKLTGGEPDCGCGLS